MKKLFIIGAGPGEAGLITPCAREIAESCDVLIGTSRVNQNFPGADCMTLSEINQVLDESEKNNGETDGKDNGNEKIGLLVSGDAGFFSLSESIRQKFGNRYEIRTVNGFNSLQYFAAKLGIRYDDAAICSMHGREADLTGKASYNRKVFVLTGGENNAQKICRDLSDVGLGHLKVSAGEKLSYEDERILRGTAAELSSMKFDDLTVLFLENDNPANIYITLTDDDFIRGEAPMTKEEVRNIVLSKMNIHPEDTIFDIGAGTGSVTIASAYKAHNGVVYGIEKNEKALALAYENRKKHGAFNIRLVSGEAPEAIAKLPKPSAVFIGGSGGNLSDIIACCRNKNPDVRIVATSVTLQTLNEIVSAGFEEIVSINVARSKKAGAYDLMLAQNPVYVAVM